MDMYNRIARSMMIPVVDAIRGTHVKAYLEDLEKTQWWSAEELRELQLRRLQEAITRAYDHVAYYRRIMDERGLSPSDISCAEDLTKLPILTKTLVRANFDDLIADNIPKRTLLLSGTGGSTGSPLKFYQTNDDRFSHSRARGLLAMQWAGVGVADCVASFPDLTGPPNMRERFLAPLSRRFRRAIHFDVTRISDETLPSIVQGLRQAHPKAIAAYPSVLSILASHIKDSGQPAPDIHALLTGGEQMFEHQRALLREVFNREPFSRYGMNENSLLGTECEHHSGFHMFAQDLAIEIVDDDAQPVAANVDGHILVTNLRARGMPFIRYDTGDIGAWATEPCACGRAMPLLSRVTGRTCDVLYTPTGNRVSGTSIEMTRFSKLGITGFQIVQETLDELTMRVVIPSDAIPEQERVRHGVVEILHKNVASDMRITVEYVDRIEPTAAGKYVPIISRVSPDSWLNRAREQSS
ncbi:MAG: phenylacetate--CoA ligase family protein [Dehalococcoidia bacterium]|nr:phenylacetate--CoA ligase family protein [Dehalococcoidia bacterium]